MPDDSVGSVLAARGGRLRARDSRTGIRQHGHRPSACRSRSRRRSCPRRAGIFSTSSTGSTGRGWPTCRPAIGSRASKSSGGSWATGPPGGPGADPVLRRPRPQGRFRHRHGRAGPAGDPRRPDGRPGVEPGPGAQCRPIRSTRSPRSPSTSPTPSDTPGSSATARASTPRAACSRPRSPRTPSGWGR